MGGGMSLFAEIIAPSVASLLMARSPWIPLIIGISAFILGPALVVFVPETLHLRPRESESTTLTPDAASEQSISTINEDDKPSFFGTITSQAINGLKDVYGSLSVLHSLPILLLLVVFLISPFQQQSVGLSVRYISNRFHWKLRQTGFLLSMRALINFVLLLALLPGLSHYLIKHLHFSSMEKDIVLARSSVLVLIVGALMISISPTVIWTIIGIGVFTLGTGTVALTRSLVTSLVDQEHVGRLYAAIGLVEICGALTAGPTLAGLYTLGLQLQFPGLPYLACALVCFFGAIGIWTFGCLTRKHPRDRVPSGEEDGVENSLLVISNSAEGGAINFI
jgi:MFS family permease